MLSKVKMTVQLNVFQDASIWETPADSKQAVIALPSHLSETTTEKKHSGPIEGELGVISITHQLVFVFSQRQGCQIIFIVYGQPRQKMAEHAKCPLLVLH